MARTPANRFRLSFDQNQVPVTTRSAPIWAWFRGLRFSKPSERRAAATKLV
jgi:hypothetical protein